MRSEGILARIFLNENDAERIVNGILAVGAVWAAYGFLWWVVRGLRQD